jgi:methylmalonyl-CoA mutase N-terminal domain/subunit
MDNTAQTSSGIPLDAVYGPGMRRVNRLPGEFPFTRGNFSSGYRGRLWTFRQYSGFGTAEESNARYRYLLDQGGTGLSVALDLPTQCGYDSTTPSTARRSAASGGGGHPGRRRDPVRRHPPGQDQHQLHHQRHRGHPARFYVAAAEKAGVPREKLTGTIQNDILKEYASRGTWIWPPEPSLRLIADTIEFCAAEVPRFNAISVAGAHFRDAGANAVQEMAFTWPTA